MIPKIIHWCWFSKKIPENIQRYIDTWKKFMPGYEIICWNADNFDVNSIKWVKQAVEHEKWAFAADYIRLWAVYNYGGIYLDSDVEVLKPFDDLLHLQYFLGRENEVIWNNNLEIATFGAEKKCFWLRDLLDYYQNRNFDKGGGELDLTVLPLIAKHILEKKHKGKLQILSSDYFSPKNKETMEISITKNTYSIHHFRNSWVKDMSELYPKIHIPKLNMQKLYVWGTGRDGFAVFEQCKENNVQIEAFLDSKAEKGEYIFEGLPCLAPVKILSQKERSFFIVVGSRGYSHEIYKILKNYGLEENKDYWLPVPSELIDY